MVPNKINVTDAPYNAACDNSTDDWDRIQAALHDVANGGKLIIPGMSRVSQQTVISKSITLEGYGVLSGLNSQSDINVLDFQAGPDMDTCFIEKMSIYGGQNANAQHNVVAIEKNQCVHMRDLRVWGGFSALYDLGVDGRRYNCFFSGAATNGGAVTSQGANWWDCVKMDQAFGRQAWAFLQGGPPTGGSGVLENHFDMCDFSGDYDNSLLIDDGGTQTAVSGFTHSVFSSPITIARARWTGFSGTCEFGAGISAGNNPVTVGDSYGFGGVTVTGTQRALSNNFAIS